MREDFIAQKYAVSKTVCPTEEESDKKVRLTLRSICIAGRKGQGPGIHGRKKTTGHRSDQELAKEGQK